MGKRSLPPGVKCVPLTISATPHQVARLRRRAAEERARGNLTGGTLSGVIRMDGHAAQQLRHNLRNPLGALALAEEGFRRGAIDTPELLKLIRTVVDEIRYIVSEEGGVK